MNKTFIYRLRKRANIKYISVSETYQDKMKREKKVKEALKKYNTTTKALLLYSDIYEIVYYADERENHYFSSVAKIISQAKNAVEHNDTYILEQILEWIQAPTRSRLVPFLCQDILKMQIFKNRESELLEYLALITSDKEALMVYDSVDLWIENYSYLEKGYNEARKQKTRRKKSTMTYEHRLRAERHHLERELTKIGTGINRAKKLSQILLLIN